MRAKPRRHRSHPIVVLYGSSVLSLNLSARRFKKHVAAGPAPPDVDQMSGQKVDLSTSRIRCSYLARFLALVATVEAWETGENVRLHVRVKHLNIKKCAFEPSPPESTCGDVKPGSIRGSCRC